MSTYGPGNGGAPPPEGERLPVRRSRSRSPAGRSRRRRSHSSHSRRSQSRSRSPPVRRRSRSPRWRRSRSRSFSRSRSRSPPRGRGPYRDYRDRGRERYGPPHPHHGGPYGPPPDDFRGYDHRGGYGRDMAPHGPPPPFHGRDPYFGGGPFGGPPGPYGGPPPPQRRGERKRRDEGPPGVSLLIRNVSPDMTTHDLQMAFGRIGNVRDVYIPRDFHSQQPKGFAFIEYATPEMAREARDEMDRFVVKGRELEVVFAQERRKTPNEMRGRVVNSQNSGRDSRRSNANFERSSSFERHKEKERQGGARDSNNVKSESNAPRSEPGGGGKAD